MRLFSDMTIFVVVEFGYRQFCKMLRKVGSELLLCAIGKLKDMMVVATCHLGTDTVVDFGVKGPWLLAIIVQIV